MQFRTIAMESWANLEHKMRYKKEMPAEKIQIVTDMLNDCAQMSHSLDLKMQQVRKIVEAEPECKGS